MDPEIINSGQCFQWAYIAHNVFEDVELYDLSHHAFIKYKGKYYDAECPEGTKDWRDLPACNWGLWHETPFYHTADSFKREWISQTRRFRTSWEQLESLVKEIIEQGYNI